MCHKRGFRLNIENIMLVFHGEFFGEISSTDLKLLASEGFSQIDDIIEFKELFTRRDIRKMVPKAFQIMISSATNAVRL